MSGFSRQLRRSGHLRLPDSLGLSGRLRRVATTVVVALLGVAMVSSCGVSDLPLPGGPKIGSDPITLKLKFRDVLDLVPQSTVKMNDVTVGKVTKVELDGYHAVVTVKLPRDTMVPRNVEASIRQTTLLGEKFVSLNDPKNPSSQRLRSGDVIGLDQTGRNPEVEEVLGALALLLNGGGVGQLKTITEELNTAIGGREDEVRSVLDQIHSFMGQLNQNKEQIVASIDSLNRLAKQLNRHDPEIKSALDNLPAALKSVDSQRADLVKALKALDNLSDVGVRVIRDSKVATIDSLRSLAPVLTKLADAGDALPKSLQVLLTFPFVDAAVGNSPQAAKALHMGDYVNLSIRLDVDLTKLPDLPEVSLPGLPSVVCDTLAQVTARAKQAAAAVVDVLPVLTTAQKNKLKAKIVARLLDQAQGQCRAPSLNKMIDVAESLLPDLLDVLGIDLPSIPVPSVPGLPGGLLGRAGPSVDGSAPKPVAGRDGRIDVLDGPFGTVGDLGYNSTLGALLLQGVEGQ